MKTQKKSLQANGYIQFYAPQHPLSGSGGQVSEHRALLYDLIGEGPHPCHHNCGKLLKWSPGYAGGDALEVDHLDFNRTNNSPENIVPSCRSCNVKRAWAVKKLLVNFSTAA